MSAYGSLDLSTKDEQKEKREFALRNQYLG